MRSLWTLLFYWKVKRLPTEEFRGGFSLSESFSMLQQYLILNIRYCGSRIYSFQRSKMLSLFGEECFQASYELAEEKEEESMSFERLSRSHISWDTSILPSNCNQLWRESAQWETNSRMIHWRELSTHSWVREGVENRKIEQTGVVDFLASADPQVSYWFEIWMTAWE